jgi:hypothetical protein
MDIPAINHRMAELAFKKRTGQLTAEEAVELTGIIESSPRKKALFDELMDSRKIGEQLMIISEFDAKASWKKVNQMLNLPLPPKRVAWMKYVAAAAVVLVAFGLFFYFSRDRTATLTVVQNGNKGASGNITTGDGIAVITNTDGAAITIGQTQSGIVGYIDGEPVIKDDNVLICPNIASAGLAVRTLAGKTLTVKLSDGTMAWMSGNSELSFANGFIAGKRELALKGETYFEVAKKGKETFAVMVGGMTVTVLGTRFTVSAYGDQGPVTTSLFEGEVQLTVADQMLTLLPGEEATFADNKLSKQGLKKQSVNRMEGKKSGLFIFDGDIKEILDEVAKNYDYSVEYIGKMPDKTFSGTFSRQSSPEQLLRNLSKVMGISLTIKGKKIVVDYTKAG